MTARGGEPRLATAEAEADREDALPRAALRRAQPVDGGADVGLQRGRLGLGDVLQVVEAVVALGDPGRAAEPVDRDGGVAALGEAQGELLVEAIQAADVRQDDDPDGRGVVRRRGEGREARSVGRAEHEFLMRDRGARDLGNGRQRVQLEAHAGV